jgi:hypothetical protein
VLARGLERKLYGHVLNVLWLCYNFSRFISCCETDGKSKHFCPFSSDIYSLCDSVNVGLLFDTSDESYCFILLYEALRLRILVRVRR